MTGKAKKPTGRTLARAKAQLRAMKAGRVCETLGCGASIADRDESARYCLRCVRRRVIALNRKQRIARNRSAHKRKKGEAA